MMLVLAGGGHGVVSHRSAARLHGLDGFDHAGMAVVEASVTRSFRLRLPDTVTHHVTPLEPCDLTSVGGLPCTSLARTLADLGSVVRDRRRASRALTAARRRRRSTRRCIARHRGAPSPSWAVRHRHAAAACSMRSPTEGRVPDSWFEELLRLVRRRPSACRRSSRSTRSSGPTATSVARADIAIPVGEAAAWRLTAAGSTSGPSPSRSTRTATWPRQRADGSSSHLGWYATKRPAEVLRRVEEVVRGPEV